MHEALQVALKNGRVTALTSDHASIMKAVRLGYLTEGELAGVYVLTVYGRCEAGDPPF